jgi:hypothetical protein
VRRLVRGIQQKNLDTAHQARQVGVYKYILIFQTINAVICGDHSGLVRGIQQNNLDTAHKAR